MFTFKNFFWKCLGLCALVLMGCGSSTNSNDQSSSNTPFYDAVQLVAPSFTPVSNSSLNPLTMATVTTTWETGNPLYELFYILRTFNPDTDNGVIDTSNLYKSMWEAKNFFTNAKSNCQAITEQTITPPFNFENTATTYNCAYNEDTDGGYDFGGALKELDANGNIVEITSASRNDTTAAIKYGVFGFVWVDSNHNEYGTLQAILDTLTDDLSVDIALWVDYDGANDYCYRNDINGNTSTHLFTFRSIKGNKVADSAYISIIGKGYSQGTGNYFLVKITNNDLTGKYYCIGAEDGETELRAMSAEGSDTVDANCAPYQSDVDAITPFTTEDLACETSDFNPGGTGTASEGTIFLNYQ
ncbi:MAG: hypothetical protein HYU97_00760 [Deltaproteobacteria bacterium]|nr:hypothetical protein [Deltaproteobacteria bacterium]